MFVFERAKRNVSVSVHHHQKTFVRKGTRRNCYSIHQPVSIDRQRSFTDNKQTLYQILGWCTPCAFQRSDSTLRAETRYRWLWQASESRVSRGRQMKSESEMPLRVAPASATSLLLPPTIDNSIRSQRMSSAAPHSAPGGGLPAVGDRQIVLNALHTSTQNSALKFLVPDSTRRTESQIESHAKIFSEHRKTHLSDTATVEVNEKHTQQLHYSHPHQFQTIEEQERDPNKTIQHTIHSSDDTSFGESFHFTPVANNTQSHELRNREHRLGFSAVEPPDNTIINITQRRPFETHYFQQQQHSLIPLPQHPQPPVQYTATAAEIAHPSYSQNHKMGDGSIAPYGVLHRDAKRDMLISRGKETDEDASGTSNSTDSITGMSPGRMTPVHDTSSDRIMVGTPSTVSTAPSSDDEGLQDLKLVDEPSTLSNLLHPLHRRRRSFGEEDMLHNIDPQRLNRGSRNSNRELNPWMQQALPRHPHHVPQRSWDGATPLVPSHQLLPNQQHQPQQRVASFRDDGHSSQQLKQNEKGQHGHNQRFAYQPSLKEYYSLQQQQQQQHFPFQQQQQQQIPLPPGHRKISYSHHSASKTTSPPRSGRSQRQQGNRQNPLGGQTGSPHQPGSSSQRSSSEVLKTLLRKKACLYEPGTSRSVALVTWLVGRVLALEFGFFSRQQLQSGVHACVSSKIEAGTITRTKVNRCMQIILNSCFHYIIPRSDGSEEKGDYFRESFSETVQDDSLLLKELPKPWNDLVVDRDTVINAILHDTEEKTPQQASIHARSPSASPKHSPKFSNLNSEKGTEKFGFDGEKEEASKRAVLLCFNENVRSAEDVFRCHNDFIRDTANASNLQLTAQEWGQFFGHEVSRDPHLLGKIGVPNQAGVSSGGPPIQPDLLGRMSPDEVGKFRTTWCTKRYEHDHDLCGFAHIEINGGWLRRNPLVHPYKNEMCSFVTRVRNEMVPPGAPGNFFLNECPNGVHCGYSHSAEEINYHPESYKKKVCTAQYLRSGGCRLGDVCSNAHPIDSNRPFKKSLPDGRSPDKRGKKNFEQGKMSSKPCHDSLPSGSPVVYASPAPVSRFERQLVMPGLQNLYRRQSEVVRAYVRSSGKCQCSYSLFGDKVIS